MNKVRQFRALFGFQMAMNPAFLFMPLALSAPYIITFSRVINHAQLHFLLSNQNLFFVGFIGFMLLDPEAFRWGASDAMGSSGNEFLLTRAVDRHLVFRARSALFYFLILSIPLAALLFTLKNPDVQIGEYDKSSYQQVLDHIPGSIAAPPDKYGGSENITIPNGNTLIQSWRIWLYLCLAIGTQVFVLLIYPLKYRRYVFWAAFLVGVFAPLVMDWIFGFKDGALSNEAMFFAYVAHQWLFWSMTAAALLLGQLWCERRFARQEH